LNHAVFWLSISEAILRTNPKADYSYIRISIRPKKKKKGNFHAYLVHRKPCRGHSV